MKNKVIIFSAPSGSGKSTIISYLLYAFPSIEFSVSATSRAPRGKEKNGKEYFFFSTEDFKEKIKNGEFVEYEEVYSGSFYGTLKSELERIWKKGNVILFDVDVKGGINLKKLFGSQALSVFIKTPSVEVLKERLIKRGTDSMEAIEKRISKVEDELKYESEFDAVLVNDNLEKCLKEADSVIGNFINGKKVALFFGSFNPIHIGHLAIAKYLLECCEVDQVRLIISPQNPLKKVDPTYSEKERLSDAENRLECVKKSINNSGLPIVISDVEFSLPQPLYTINTLRYLRKKEPENKHILVIGGDNLAIIEKWHDWKELLNEFEVWVYPRKGYKAKTLSKKYGVKYLNAKLQNISSTMIRKGEANGKNMEKWKL